MALVFRCDKPDCDTEQPLDDRRDLEPDGWLRVTWDEEEFHFCSRDCLMFWSAVEWWSGSWSE